MNEFDELLEKATTTVSKLSNPNRSNRYLISSIWSLILRGEVDSRYALNALKLKLFSTNKYQAAKVLQLLKIMEKVFGFVREYLLSREFCDVLYELAKTTKNEELRRRLLQQMHAWNFKFRNNPKNDTLKDTINIMKSQGFKFPKKWVDSSTCHSCFIELIDVYPFKNHCRACGQVFCDLCSTKTASLPEYGTKRVCVCDSCFEQLKVNEESPMTIISSNNTAAGMLYESTPNTEVSGLYQSTTGGIFCQSQQTCQTKSKKLTNPNPRSTFGLTQAPISSIFCHRSGEPCSSNSRRNNDNITTSTTESFDSYFKSLANTEASGFHKFSNSIHRSSIMSIFGLHQPSHQRLLSNSGTLPNSPNTTTPTTSFGSFKSLPSTATIRGVQQSFSTLSLHVPINNTAPINIRSKNSIFQKTCRSNSKSLLNVAVVKTQSFNFSNSPTNVKSDAVSNFFKHLEKTSLNINNDNVILKKYSNTQEKINGQKKLRNNSHNYRNNLQLLNTPKEKLQSVSVKNKTDENGKLSPEETKRLRELERAEKIRLMKKKCEKYLQYQKEHADELYQAKEL